MIDDKFDFGFAVDWMRKDLGLCLDEARTNGATLPVAALVDQFYADLQATWRRSLGHVVADPPAAARTHLVSAGDGCCGVRPRAHRSTAGSAAHRQAAVAQRHPGRGRRVRHADRRARRARTIQRPVAGPDLGRRDPEAQDHRPLPSRPARGFLRRARGGHWHRRCRPAVPAPMDIASAHRSTGATPKTSLSRVQFFDVLQMCIDKLPGNLARIFMMREWLGVETAEICKEIGITSTNCFVMLFRRAHATARMPGTAVVRTGEDQMRRRLDPNPLQPCAPAAVGTHGHAVDIQPAVAPVAAPAVLRCLHQGRTSAESHARSHATSGVLIGLTALSLPAGIQPSFAKGHFARHPALAEGHRLPAAASARA